MKKVWDVKKRIYFCNRQSQKRQLVKFKKGVILAFQHHPIEELNEVI